MRVARAAKFDRLFHWQYSKNDDKEYIMGYWIKKKKRVLSCDRRRQRNSSMDTKRVEKTCIMKIFCLPEVLTSGVQ